VGTNIHIYSDHRTPKQCREMCPTRTASRLSRDRITLNLFKDLTVNGLEENAQIFFLFAIYATYAVFL
jgi:hypothetical protein